MAALHNCVIVLSGKFEETHAKIKKLIKENGGKHSANIAAETQRELATHLVTTTKDFEAKVYKVREARQYRNIRIVNYDWLWVSINSYRRAPEAQYEFHEPDSDFEDATISMGKKRARSPTSSEEGDSKKPKDAQRAKSASLHIPVDETCPLARTHRVYIDMDDGMIYDAALNQTNAGENNNKFYRVQVLVGTSAETGDIDYQTWTRWGRVGEQGKGMTIGNGGLGAAMDVFMSKFRDKAGVPWSNRFDAPKGSRQKGYYTFIERKYEDDSDDDPEDVSIGGPGASKMAESSGPVPRVDSKLPKSVQRLMELIFNQQFFDDTMRELDYDADKLPLGKLSKRTLETGFEILKDIEKLLLDPSIAESRHNKEWPEAIAASSNAFYSVIPHTFGRRRPPVISSDEKLKKEINLMESLSDMQIASVIMKNTGEDALVNPLDRQFAGLGLQEMAPLDMDSDEFTLLQEYLIKSHGHTHQISFKVQDIFRLERNGEEKRFEQSPYSKLRGSDRRLLWHGSRVTNYGGILSQGLRIAPPEAPVNGYAFGKGVYLADISSKSANYCQSHASSNTGLLLLCEVELGKPMLELEIGQSDAAEVAKQNGCIATWGKGATVPRDWKDAGCVHPDLKGVMMPDTTMEPAPANYEASYLQYNEYIAYDIAQVRLRYLLRVEMSEG